MDFCIVFIPEPIIMYFIYLIKGSCILGYSKGFFRALVFRGVGELYDFLIFKIEIHSLATTRSGSLDFSHCFIKM